MPANSKFHLHISYRGWVDSLLKKSLSMDMVTVDILNSDSLVGFPGERCRFFLSDEGCKNARASKKRGEIKIRNHAAVMARKLYPDKEPSAQER